jgi:3-oxoadipate CoA-transferase beta subunit
VFDINADGVTVRDTYGIGRAELAQRLDVTLLNC